MLPGKILNIVYVLIFSSLFYANYTYYRLCILSDIKYYISIFIAMYIKFFQCFLSIYYIDYIYLYYFPLLWFSYLYCNANYNVQSLNLYMKKVHREIYFFCFFSLTSLNYFMLYDIFSNKSVFLNFMSAFFFLIKKCLFSLPQSLSDAIKFLKWVIWYLQYPHLFEHCPLYYLFWLYSVLWLKQ